MVFHESFYLKNRESHDFRLLKHQFLSGIFAVSCCCGVA